VCVCGGGWGRGYKQIVGFIWCEKVAMQLCLYDTVWLVDDVATSVLSFWFVVHELKYS
jgi:hypothetical protein